MVVAFVPFASAVAATEDEEAYGDDDYEEGTTGNLSTGAYKGQKKWRRWLAIEAQPT